MADVFSKEKRSEVMSKIKSKNTRAELLLFNLVRKFWNQGYRYRKHYKGVVGKPDLAFPKYKLAIFIDSEFWHGKDFKNWQLRLPSDFWKNKIAGNINRDQVVNTQLGVEGWTVFRIWIDDFLKHPEVFVNKISKEITHKYKK